MRRGKQQDVVTQSETGSAIPGNTRSCIPRGDTSIGESSIPPRLTSGHQQADTGTKMIHIGKTRAQPLFSKLAFPPATARTATGLVKNYADGQPSTPSKFPHPMRLHTGADWRVSRSYVPAALNAAITARSWSITRRQHHASVKIAFLLSATRKHRSEEDAISMIVNGFCKDVFSELPLEFAVEAQKPLAISPEHSVG